MKTKVNVKILRKEVSTRGGGIEVEVIKGKFKGVRMTAYQNYLGGGILGRVENDCTYRGWWDQPELADIAEWLRKYYHSLTNPEGTWEGMSYEQNQSLPVSAY